jgi:DNA invertase Pin-like site-specific DNA recombinase
VSLSLNGNALENASEGVARAKAEGRYKGRAPLQGEIVAKVKAMLADDRRPTYIAKQLKIGRSSVYRVKAGAEA